VSLKFQLHKKLRDLVIAGHVNYDNVAAAGTTDIVNTVNLTNANLTVAAQPDVPRSLVITVVDSTPGIVAGLVTITGKNALGQTISEVVNCAAGAATYLTNNAFSIVSTVVTSNFSVLGGGGDETIAVGSGLKLGLPVKYLRDIFKACVDGADEAVGTVNLTYGTIITTTAPNGTRDYDFWFRYYLAPLNM
jgi:hypothetical protein